jgi:hypothetical protein
VVGDRKEGAPLARDLGAQGHSSVVDETKTFSVSLVSKDSSLAVDEYYKYCGGYLSSCPFSQTYASR